MGGGRSIVRMCCSDDGEVTARDRVGIAWTGSPTGARWAAKRSRCRCRASSWPPHASDSTGSVLALMLVSWRRRNSASGAALGLERRVATADMARERICTSAAGGNPCQEESASSRGLWCAGWEAA